MSANPNVSKIREFVHIQHNGAISRCGLTTDYMKSTWIYEITCITCLEAVKDDFTGKWASHIPDIENNPLCKGAGKQIDAAKPNCVPCILVREHQELAERAKQVIEDTLTRKHASWRF